jgi:signal transduction histidine kinase
MKLRTLRARLLRTLTLSLLVVFVALWMLLVFGIRHVSERQMLMHLEHDADSVLAAVDFAAGYLPRLERRGLEAIYDEPHSGHYYEVQLDGHGLALSPSLEGRTLTSAGTPPAQGDFRATGPAGQHLIVLANTRTIAGHQVTAFVAEDMSDVNLEIRKLSAWAFLLLVVVMPVALVLQGLAVRRALLPLDALRLQLQEVGAGRDTRIEGEVPLEIKPLVDELNRLLAVLERRLNQSRTALGNLAHALKTPLAMLIRGAENAAWPVDARAQVQEQAVAIRERLERELRRARLAGPVAPGGAMFNAAAELDVLVKVLREVYRGKNLEIAVEAPREMLPFDREDMLELVGNLADNACKWAKSRVAIRVRRDAREVLVTVADDGPGCDEAQAATILERGTRLDEATPGHGLGLAIVRDAVDFYDGTLRVSRDAELGGLRMEVVLPLG